MYSSVSILPDTWGPCTNTLKVELNISYLPIYQCKTSDISRACSQWKDSTWTYQTINGQNFKTNPVFCRWCGSFGFIRHWPPDHTGTIYSQAGLRISASKSEIMVPSWKRLDCPLLDELLPQLENIISGLGSGIREQRSRRVACRLAQHWQGWGWHTNLLWWRESQVWKQSYWLATRFTIPPSPMVGICDSWQNKITDTRYWNGLPLEGDPR